jgi:hypothetical protein
MQDHLNLILALCLNDDIQTEFNSHFNAILDPDLYCLKLCHNCQLFKIGMSGHRWQPHKVCYVCAWFSLMEVGHTIVSFSYSSHHTMSSFGLSEWDV